LIFDPYNSIKPIARSRPSPMAHAAPGLNSFRNLIAQLREIAYRLLRPVVVVRWLAGHN